MDNTPKSVSPEDTSGRRTAEIRHDIEHTRADLSETIDALQETLRPRNLVANAKERVKHATTERLKDMAHRTGQAAEDFVFDTRDRAEELIDTTRHNPIPAALFGFGAAWLLMRGNRNRSDIYSDYDYDYGYEYEQSSSGLFGRIKENPVPAVLAGIGLSWLAMSNQSRGEGRYGNGAVASAKQTMSEQAERLSSRASEYAGDAQQVLRRTGQRAQSQIERLVTENPLLVSAAALVIGAAVGLSLPESQTENEWLGEARETFVDKAQDVARSAASNVQRAAGEAANEVVSQVVSGRRE